MLNTSNDYHRLNPLKHGESSTRLYNVWVGIKQRCLNKNNKAYPDYGGKGVKLYPEWVQYEPFRDWALSSGYQEGLTIDRKDSMGNYEPSNCRWLTRAENCILAHQQPFKVMDPEGNIHEGVNLAEFCRGNNLDPSCMGKVLRGKRPHHKNWRAV